MECTLRIQISHLVEWLNISMQLKLHYQEPVNSFYTNPVQTNT